jgi:acyl-CoA thioester hydrolase
MENKIFSLQMKVRSYECDSGNGVNHSVFLNYLEHARYEFLTQELGWDIPALIKQDIGFVLVKTEVDYRRSLEVSNDFVIETQMKRESKRRFVFTQNIYLLPDRQPIVDAKMTATVINLKTLRSEVPDLLESMLSERFPIPLN